MAERVKHLLHHLSASRDISAQQTMGVAPAVGAVSGGRYKYTLDGCRLTEEQRQFYEENGYIVIPKLVPEELLQKYVRRFRELTDGGQHVPGLVKMKDVSIVKKTKGTAEHIITKIQDFQNDEELFSFCELPQIVDYVEGFVGPNVNACHTMLINKPPDPGTKSSRHPMHQDLYYFPFRPAERIVCAWTALQHVHRGNGCLVAVPGTHRGELQQHDYPEWEGGVNKMYHGVRGWSQDNPRVHLEMGPGDTVFFHPILLHGSGRNMTDGFRKAISCHYSSSNCYYIDVAGTVQENITREVDEIAKRRLGAEVQFSYTDLWRLRSRLVRGEAGPMQG